MDSDERRISVTLKFLGGVSDEQLEQIKERLRSLVYYKHRFCLNDVGVFSPDNVMVVWVGIAPEQPLMALHDAVNDALADLFQRDGRFHPHLTVARVKSLKNRKEFLEELSGLEVRKLCFDIGGFSLFPASSLHKGLNTLLLRLFRNLYKLLVKNSA